MELKRKKDGSVVVTTKSHVVAAIEEHKKAQALLDELLSDPTITELEEYVGALKTAIDGFVLEKGQFEGSGVKLTRVQGHRRAWNIDKLEAILPRGIFKNIVKYQVDSQKIDEYVRAKKIDEKKIAVAYEETPNKPYVRWSEESDKTKQKSEAESLAEALNG